MSLLKPNNNKKSITIEISPEFFIHALEILVLIEHSPNTKLIQANQPQKKFENEKNHKFNLRERKIMEKKEHERSQT